MAMLNNTIYNHVMDNIIVAIFKKEITGYMLANNLNIVELV